MATPAQIEANRRNALNSTGPRTPEGKAAVASNAVKHGMRSRHPVIPGYENEAEFEHLRTVIHERLEPRGEMEIRLADRIADAEWWLDRIARIETEWFEHLWSGAATSQMESSHDRLMRYEAHLTRLVSRTLRDLDRLRHLAPPLPQPCPEPASVANSAEQSQSSPGKPTVPIQDFFRPPGSDGFSGYQVTVEAGAPKARSRARRYGT